MRSRFLLVPFAAASLLATPVLAADARVDALFAEAPQPPPDGCGASREAKDRYARIRQDFVERLTAEVRQRRKETKAARKKDEAVIRKEQSARTNMPAGMDRARMKSMTKAERMAMAQQMMAQGQTPGGPPAPGAAEVGQSQELQQLSQQVAAREQEARARLTAFEAEEVPRAEAAQARELTPLRRELNELTGDTIAPDAAELARWSPAARQAWNERQARGEQVRQRLLAASRRHCAEFGPRLLDALTAYRAGAVALRSDWDRLEQAQTAQATAFTGVAMTRVAPGLLALEGLQRYAAALESGRVFRFDVSADLTAGAVRQAPISRARGRP